MQVELNVDVFFLNMIKAMRDLKTSTRRTLTKNVNKWIKEFRPVCIKSLGLKNHENGTFCHNKTAS